MLRSKENLALALSDFSRADGRTLALKRLKVQSSVHSEDLSTDFGFGGCLKTQSLHVQMTCITCTASQCISSTHFLGTYSHPVPPSTSRAVATLWYLSTENREGIEKKKMLRSSTELEILRRLPFGLDFGFAPAHWPRKLQMFSLKSDFRNPDS